MQGVFKGLRPVTIGLIASAALLLMNADNFGETPEHLQSRRTENCRKRMRRRSLAVGAAHMHRTIAAVRIAERRL